MCLCARVCGCVCVCVCVCECMVASLLLCLCGVFSHVEKKQELHGFAMVVVAVVGCCRCDCCMGSVCVGAFFDG